MEYELIVMSSNHIKGKKNSSVGFEIQYRPLALHASHINFSIFSSFFNQQLANAPAIFHDDRHHYQMASSG
jgi:hypothetical protein